MKIKLKKLKRGTEFINPETNSDKELWDDIDSPEDDAWRKMVSLQTYMQAENTKSDKKDK